MKKRPFYHFCLTVGLLVLLGGIQAKEPNSLDFQSWSQGKRDALVETLELLAPDFPPETGLLPTFTLDRMGQTWATWEECRPEPNRIKIAKFKNGGVSSLQALPGPAGFNRAPRLAFDLNNSPWIIWANYREGRFRVFVQDLLSRRLWAFEVEAGLSIGNPLLIFDQKGQPWALWNETRLNEGVIVARVFSHGVWTERKILRPENGYPALNPDALIDRQGSLWLVWAAYDGQDYELFLARWTGNGWGKGIQLTDDQENDGFPALAQGKGGLPLLAWTRSTSFGEQVCIATIANSQLEKKAVLSSPELNLIAPRFYETEQETKLLWKSIHGIEVETVSAGPTGRVDLPSSPPFPGIFLFNPSLDENIYICFGDSITYGYIDREPAPELGYVPRLEKILNQNFGPTIAINQGIGGENTIGGLARIDSVLKSQQGRFILIMEGTNDVITPGLAMSTSASNLAEMVKRCLKAGVFPVLTTILPRYDSYGVIQYYADRILELNQMIRQLVVSFPISFVDMDEIFNNYPVSDGGVFALLSHDLKHPSAKGYQVMAESWFNEIKNIPFPPVHIEITSYDGNVNFGSSRQEGVHLRYPKTSSPSLEQPVGTLIRWQDNPKIFDPSRIQSYRIFRKDRRHPQARFRFLALVRSPLQFFDPGLHTLDRYTYVISTLREDGVEGPCSPEIKE
ncbi:MAG: GDSL-type esterase/lipase family protein [Candidatus Aminicenantales bacterium]